MKLFTNIVDELSLKNGQKEDTKDTKGSSHGVFFENTNTPSFQQLGHETKLALWGVGLVTGRGGMYLFGIYVSPKDHVKTFTERINYNHNTAIGGWAKKCQAHPVKN